VLDDVAQVCAAVLSTSGQGAAGVHEGIEACHLLTARRPGATEGESRVPSIGRVAKVVLNQLILLGFRDGDGQAAELSPKNGVLDNGRYHERQTVIPSARPLVRRLLSQHRSTGLGRCCLSRMVMPLDWVRAMITSIG